MIFSPQGASPRKQHWNESEAVSEAERLACMFPSQEFFLMESKRVCHIKSPVTWEEC